MCRRPRLPPQPLSPHALDASSSVRTRLRPTSSAHDFSSLRSSARTGRPLRDRRPLGGGPGGRHLSQPGAARGLLRPRRDPRGRRLLDDGIELQPRARPAHPALARSGELVAGQPRPPSPGAGGALRDPAPRRGRMGSVDTPPRRQVLDLLSRPRFRPARHHRDGSARRVERAGDGAG